MVASGPNKVTPEGQTSEQLPGKDPLDPQGLNRPITGDEQQRIADTLTKIVANDTKELDPHPYRNFPDPGTGAVLPNGDLGYTVFDVPGIGAGRGEGRVIVDSKSGAMFYTNNHYKSFYPLKLNPR